MAYKLNPGQTKQNHVLQNSKLYIPDKFSLSQWPSTSSVAINLSSGGIRFYELWLTSSASRLPLTSTSIHAHINPTAAPLLFTLLDPLPMDANDTDNELHIRLSSCNKLYCLCPPTHHSTRYIDIICLPPKKKHDLNL